MSCRIKLRYCTRSAHSLFALSLPALKPVEGNNYLMEPSSRSSVRRTVVRISHGRTGENRVIYAARKSIESDGPVIGKTRRRTYVRTRHSMRSVSRVANDVLSRDPASIKHSLLIDRIYHLSILKVLHDCSVCPHSVGRPPSLARSLARGETHFVMEM